MVLGEPQILGQMKQAVREADAAGAPRDHAAPAVPAQLCCGQGGAHLTEIGAHSISMAAAAVRLASQLFEDLARSACSSSARAR